jgi:hypothetical protein
MLQPKQAVKKLTIAAMRSFEATDNLIKVCFEGSLIVFFLNF